MPFVASTSLQNLFLVPSSSSLNKLSSSPFADTASLTGQDGRGDGHSLASPQSLSLTENTEAAADLATAEAPECYFWFLLTAPHH